MILKRKESRRISSKNWWKDWSQMNALSVRCPISKYTKWKRSSTSGTLTQMGYSLGKSSERVQTNGNGDRSILRECRKLLTIFSQSRTNTRCKAKTRNQRRWPQKHFDCKGHWPKQNLCKLYWSISHVLVQRACCLGNWVKDKAWRSIHSNCFKERRQHSCRGCTYWIDLSGKQDNGS